jgi:hypothetical protein
MMFDLNTPGSDGARKLRNRRLAPRYFQNPNPKYRERGSVLSVHSATAVTTMIVK